jgi:hypothetical protein
MKMKTKTIAALSALGSCLALWAVSGCTKPAEDTAGPPEPATQTTDQAPPAGGDEGGGHGHAEVPLGSTIVGGIEIECAQGHGETAPGKEMHLVVKLPYNDNGATIVRAWIGTDDRLQSLVTKGDYAPAHDDFDVHAEAPDPLPEGAMWWIELERPDGTKAVGSIAFR